MENKGCNLVEMLKQENGVMKLQPSLREILSPIIETFGDKSTPGMLPDYKKCLCKDGIVDVWDGQTLWSTTQKFYISVHTDGKIHIFDCDKTSKPSLAELEIFFGSPIVGLYDLEIQPKWMQIQENHNFSQTLEQMKELSPSTYNYFLAHKLIPKTEMKNETFRTA